MDQYVVLVKGLKVSISQGEIVSGVRLETVFSKVRVSLLVVPRAYIVKTTALSQQY